MSRIILDMNASAATAALQQAGQQITHEVERSMGRIVLQVLTRVKRDKLSGQVLNVRTGRLRRSINSQVRPTSSGIEGLVGTNVEYAPVHELGFRGTVSVRQHLRTITQAFGRAIPAKQVSVNAHPRKVALPERSFLRSALQDLEPQIMAELQAAVQRGVGHGP